MPRTRTLATIADWESLTNKVTEEDRESDLSLKHAYEKLMGSLEEIEQLIAVRNFHEARKQEATHRIQDLLAGGRIEATFLRAAIRIQHGKRSETLVRFGMKPFRGRKRAKKKEEQRGANG